MRLGRGVAGCFSTSACLQNSVRGFQGGPAAPSKASPERSREEQTQDKAECLQDADRPHLTGA